MGILIYPKTFYEYLCNENNLALLRCFLYSNPYQLIMIMANNHSDKSFLEVNSFQCSHCSKKFGYASHLKKHLNVYIGHGPFTIRDRPYRCKHCDCSFTHIHLFKAHMRSHLEKVSYECCGIFQCCYCEMYFSTQNDLLMHMLSLRWKVKNQPNDSDELCNTTFRPILSIIEQSQNSEQQKNGVNSISGTLSESEVDVKEEPFDISEVKIEPLDIHEVKIETLDTYEVKEEQMDIFVQSGIIEKDTNETLNLPYISQKPHETNLYPVLKLSQIKNTQLNLNLQQRQDTQLTFQQSQGPLRPRERNTKTKEKHPYQCNQCGETFSILSNFSSHNRLQNCLKKRESKIAINHNTTTSRTRKQLSLKQSNTVPKRDVLHILRMLKNSKNPYEWNNFAINHNTTTFRTRKQLSLKQPNTVPKKDVLHIHRMLKNSKNPYECNQCKDTFIKWSDFSTHKMYCETYANTGRHNNFISPKNTTLRSILPKEDLLVVDNIRLTSGEGVPVAAASNFDSNEKRYNNKYNKTDTLHTPSIFDKEILKKQIVSEDDQIQRNCRIRETNTKNKPYSVNKEIDVHDDDSVNYENFENYFETFKQNRNFFKEYNLKNKDMLQGFKMVHHHIKHYNYELETNITDRELYHHMTTKYAIVRAEHCNGTRNKYSYHQVTKTWLKTQNKMSML